jgi:hypothetical protein
LRVMAVRRIHLSFTSKLPTSLPRTSWDSFVHMHWSVYLIVKNKMVPCYFFGFLKTPKSCLPTTFNESILWTQFPDLIWLILLGLA